jgi:CCR4-NOT transcriptional regulation complex NOT5 subunit
LKNYNELLNDAESIFKKPIQSTEFDTKTLDEVVNIIKLFITGRYLEKTNFTPANILKIKNDIKLYFQLLDVNENKNHINRDKIYNELGRKISIEGTAEEKGKFIRSAFS